MSRHNSNGGWPKKWRAPSRPNAGRVAVKLRQDIARLKALEAELAAVLARIASKRLGNDEWGRACGRRDELERVLGRYGGKTGLRNRVQKQLALEAQTASLTWPD
jgi:hypothetical protein